MLMSKSNELFQLAQQFMPGGVNSPVRAFKSVKSSPLFIKWACGSHVWDVDDKEYIDYMASWGPMILGHGNQDVVNAVKETVLNGTSFGAPCELEIQLAQLVCELMPSVEMVRFVNSGTEAVAGAIRLARAYTNRTKIVKFSGCYHGALDPLLVQAGSGVATLGLPDSPGVPHDVTKDTILVDYNDFSAIKEAFKIYNDQIAAVIIEPVAGNAGCILPAPGFLQLLRDLCSQYKSLLIFDEVMTGFRLSSGGAQKLFNINPDLTTMGKIIGGGLPVGAYGGKKDIMAMVAPSGPVYQAGTLSGNPLAMAAGLATLKALKALNPYNTLKHKTNTLCTQLKQIADDLSIPVQINYIESMFSIFFTDKEVVDYNSAKLSDLDLFARYFNIMLSQGIYMPPGQFESAFVSYAHSDDDIDKTCNAFSHTLKDLADKKISV
ncbi:MAG: glutamate-1-semialdehyde 2,1-aminomutase [Vampirovibrionia bacterium]